MGTILGSKAKGAGKVVFEVLLDYEEVLNLKGHMDNIHLVSERVNDVKTNISGRGKNEATKYFLIPKELRKGLKLKNKDAISCQRIDTKEKTIFVYVVDDLRNGIWIKSKYLPIKIF